MLGVDGGVHAVPITPTTSPTSSPHSSALEPWVQQPPGQRPLRLSSQEHKLGTLWGPGSLWPQASPSLSGLSFCLPVRRRVMRRPSSPFQLLRPAVPDPSCWGLS